MAAVADRGALTPERLPAFFRQLEANRAWFAAKAPPAALARVQVPGDPLVYGYYPDHGLQLQPLFNWTKANQYWFAHDYAGLQAMVDALAPLAVPQPGGWVAWEYLWDYGSGKAPWKSGMAEGVALQVLARAWQATGSTADLDLAHRVLPGFGVPTSSGGLVDASTPGWWPLYAFDPAHRVLNGDLQVVISLYDYASITGDTTALGWAQQGAQAALTALPAFDTGSWSMYDQSHEADLGYHDLMTTQLGQLAAKSGITDFRLAALRFASYRATPPVITAEAQALPAPFFPDPADGFLDTGAVTGTLSKVSSITMTVLNGDGAVVAAESLGRRPRGPLTITWNGRVGGRPAAPGDYTLAATAVDLAGNRADPVAVGQVRIVRDVTPPQVVRVRVGRSEGQLRLRWAVRDATTPWVNLTVQVDGRGRRLFHLPQAGVRVVDVTVDRRPG
jgi:hypothetical protein